MMYLSMSRYLNRSAASSRLCFGSKVILRCLRTVAAQGLLPWIVYFSCPRAWGQILPGKYGMSKPDLSVSRIAPRDCLRRSLSLELPGLIPASSCGESPH